MITCSVYKYMDELVGEKDPYRLPNHKDVFPYEEYDYDGALTRVRDDINRILENFFNGKLSIVPSDSISEGTSSECPESRRYELEILDKETNALLYGLIYQSGRIRTIIGNLPIAAISSVLKNEGAWEGIPETVKDLYRRLKARIRSESKKIAEWEKERDDIRRNKELSTDQIKKIRELINKIERSYRIIREDESRIKQLEEQYIGIEKIVK